MNPLSVSYNLFVQGRVQEALQTVEAGLKDDDANAEWYNLAGICAAALGDFRKAGYFWRQTVRLDPGAAGAYFNLGLLYARSGRDEDAEGFYRKALSIDPANAGACNNLGLLLARQKRDAEAEYWYRNAIRQGIANSETFTNLGVLLAGRGDMAAEDCYRQALSLDPGNGEAYCNLGVLLAGQKQTDAAEACYRKAVSLNPGNAAAHSNLGILLASCKKYDEAEDCYRKAVSLDPGHAEAYTNLGLVLETLQRGEEAEQCHRKAVQLNPGSAEIHTNLASILAGRRWDDPEAEAHYLQAIRIRPASAFTHSNYGVYLTNLKREAEAEQRFRHALELDPGYELAHLNLGFLLLSRGRYEEGWIHHESRYSPGLPDSNIPLPDLPFPKWQGEPLEGKSLLVWLEQGLGDEIQFCRYLPHLKMKWGVRRITYVCKAALKPLMETLSGVDDVLAVNGARLDLSVHDYWTLPLSFPRYWKEDTGTFPSGIPYLKALPDRIARWAPRLPEKGFRAGLVWRGNARHHNDADRSLPGLSTLLPLWSVPGVRFISLQKGAGEDEAKRPPAGQPLLHLGSDLNDFADTAAVLQQLDLVICVDTAAAHLAGALGKPCWVLLPYFRTDWRWLRNRPDSPWYPGVMRLFRQSRRGNWPPVVDEVRCALQAAAGGSAS